MAKRFLTHIDLDGNQLINAAFEKLSSDPIAGNFEGRIYYNTDLDILKVYDGVAWVSVGAITSIEDTENEITVSIVDGVATIGLPNTIYVDVVGSLTGNADTATNANYATSAGNATTADNASNADYATEAGTANAVAVNSVYLGTDTVGDYVATVGGTDGVSLSGSGTEGRAVTITNTDKGSSQNIFKSISDGITSVVADSNNDTLTISAGTGISVTANASTDTLSIANTGVTSLSGTTNQIAALPGSTGSVTLSLPNDVIFPGTVTLNADPTQPLHAATKQYVDGAVSGLDWHPAVNLFSATNVSLTGSTNTLIVDGHAVLDNSDEGYRLLLTGQSTNSQNGIYTYTDNGSVYTLIRSDDADTYTELVGSSVFVMEGTGYGTTSWVQSNHYLSDFTGQNWVQFSGQGTYTEGNGINLDGTTLSIDTTVTVDVSTEQTLNNKTLTSPTISGLYLADNQIVIEGDPDTSETTLVFTNPTADRTITFKDATGTVAFISDIPSTTDDLPEGVINLYFTNERAQDAVGNSIVNSGSPSLSAVYNDTAGTLSFDTTLATTSYMSKTSGLAVNVSALETKLITDGFSKKVSANVGNGSATSFAVTHNLGTRDVQVQVYDIYNYPVTGPTWETVEVDVVRTDTNTVTVSFANAPLASAYRVVIVG